MTEPGYRDTARPPKVYCKDCMNYSSQNIKPFDVCEINPDVKEHPVRGIEFFYVEAREKNKNMDCRDYMPFPPEHPPETRRENSFLDPFGWALVSTLIFLIAYCLLEAFL